MDNPIEILERAGVSNYRVLWAKRIVQVADKEDLQKIMNQYPDLQVTTFAAGGWTYTTEHLEEKFVVL